MKKTTVIFALALAACLLLCACGNSQKTLEPADLSMTTGGTSITADSQIPALLDSLGDGY